MSVEIHPTAMVSKKAEIGNNVNIGPYAIIQDDVVIGDNCEIMAHAYIDRYTKLGNGVKVFPSALMMPNPIIVVPGSTPKIIRESAMRKNRE